MNALVRLHQSIFSRLKSSPTSPTLPLPVLILAGFIIHLFSLQLLLAHESDTAEVGGYSQRYNLAVIFALILLVGWIIGLSKRRFVATVLNRLPDRLYSGLVLISGLLVVAGLHLPMVYEIRQYIAVNWLLLLVISLALRPPPPASFRWLLALLLLLVVSLSLPLLITILAGRPYSPDEAMWADYASSLFYGQGIYARTWLQNPVTITPGVGWSVAGYGWLLTQVSFGLHTGRLWNIVSYLLAFAGVGLVGWRLYGQQVAWVCLAFALFSQAFLPTFDYRPDHQLPAIAMLTTFAALQARLGKPALLWHFLCGLLATLSLQLHAAGIVLAFGFSLFYLLTGLGTLFQRRSITALYPLLAFGSGALLGTGIYLVANVAAVGGLQPFLDALLGTRVNLNRRLLFLRWPSFVEWVLILSGFAYLLWRRTRADRLFLGILACVLIGIILLDYQGYRTHYNAFYVIPAGVLLVNVLAVGGEQRRSWWLTGGAIGLLAALMSSGFVAWPTVQQWLTTGQLPRFLYTELQPVIAPFIQDDDVVVSTHQLIWSLPDRVQLVSFAAEATGMKRWGLKQPIEVWQRVRPTVIIEVPGQMHFDPGLQAYMAEEAFQPCQTLNVLDIEIILYREVCTPNNVTATADTP